MKKSVAVYLILLVLFFTNAAKGEDNVSLSILDIRSLPSGKVQMIASVLDEQGIPMKGLGKSNFKLNVEGNVIKEISIEPVSSAKNPLSLILGIDVSGSMKGPAIIEAKKAASVFLDQLDKEDFTALMVFGDSVRFLTDFTQKKHEVRENIESLSATEKLTWLYQATYESLEKSSEALTSRVAVVLLTDGKDEGSLRTEEEVITKIQGTRIPVYTLGFGPKAQVDYLRKIANISSGYFLYTPRAEELSVLYVTILNQLKNQYLIDFNFIKPVGEYTGVLTLNYKGKEITTRRGFIHIASGESISWWEDSLKNPFTWVIAALAAIIVVIPLVYILRSRKPIPIGPDSDKGKPEVSIMINKKIHPIGFYSGSSDGSTMIAQSYLSKGEVGLEVDIQPLPSPFVLIDKKNEKEFNEIIITRYDKSKDHLFSNGKVYLLLSDNSVSRPDEENKREGHSRIFIDMETGSYKIEDIGSASGTKVKNNFLSIGRPITLVNGDTINVGSIPLKFYDKRPFNETKY